MNYEVVELAEKKIVGFTTRTNNNDENMTKLIGELWNKLYSEEVYNKILNRENACSIGLYSNYESDAMGDYDATVGFEVSKAESLPSGAEMRIIPKGKYAKFIVKGNMKTAVFDFWTKLWSMKLDRKYSCDFEEYQNGGDMENCEIHIYIAIN
jgi:predicted transcriptional regulator YdeE